MRAPKQQRHGQFSGSSTDFHFDELVWRDDANHVDAGRTALTAIRDDVEFERQIFLIRLARAMGGLGNQQLLDGQAGLAGKRLQKILVGMYCFLILTLDKLLRLRQKLVNPVKRFEVNIRGRGHDQNTGLE